MYCWRLSASGASLYGGVTRGDRQPRSSRDGGVGRCIMMGGEEGGGGEEYREQVVTPEEEG